MHKASNAIDVTTVSPRRLTRTWPRLRSTHGCELSNPFANRGRSPGGYVSRFKRCGGFRNRDGSGCAAGDSTESLRSIHT